MYFAKVMITLIASFGIAQGSILPLGLHKINEYPAKNCVNEDGTRNPSNPQKPSLCECVTLNKIDVSMFLRSMSGTRMYAFKNENCDPGEDGEEALGEVEGGCRALDTEFGSGRIQSIYWHTPIICEVEDAMQAGYKALFENQSKLVDGIEDML
ncbi:hypothetical protein PVAG01_01598 [Phlyctema vagabunda]|uniref:Uncharacterized protein n=1 Tax=Phlyctema vagabunda TaxID=108571 RepID=A0ABR4PXI6_9HELO